MRMTSCEAGSPLTTEKRTYCCGATSTNGLTIALTKRFICGRSGSLETTSTDLEIGPAKLLVSTLVWTLPSAPGLISLSKLETVQPHEGGAAGVTRAEPPVFLMTKSVSITWPLGTVPMSRVSAAISIFGAATVFPWAWAPAAGLAGCWVDGLACATGDAEGLDSAGFWARATPATRGAPTPSRPILRA